MHTLFSKYGAAISIEANGKILASSGFQGSFLGGRDGEISTKNRSDNQNGGRKGESLFGIIKIKFKKLKLYSKKLTRLHILKTMHQNT